MNRFGFWYDFGKYYLIPIHYSVRKCFNSYRKNESKKLFYFFRWNRQNRLGTYCIWNLVIVQNYLNVIWFSFSSVKNNEQKDHSLVHTFKRLSCSIFTFSFLLFKQRILKCCPFNVTIPIKCKFYITTWR